MQASSGALVPTEQFVAGGAESVRGYLEGERAGDSGVRATIELRTPQFSLGGTDSVWRLSGLAFLDAARLKTDRQAGDTLPEIQRLRGAGFGLRFAAPRGVTAEVDAARALVDGDTTRAGEKRVHARTLWAF
jgi:hemolysin activation/secretion protein